MRKEDLWKVISKKLKGKPQSAIRNCGRIKVEGYFEKLKRKPTNRNPQLRKDKCGRLV